ncbi:hypothetical protein BGZ83_005481 [Gryganskiella cystojenkinii]|nr:hypothetical protein BGZ83_005481 [Gryganskiella cystojenkinii]
MVSLDVVLSGAACVCFVLLFIQFLVRLMRSSYGVYRYIMVFCLIRVGDYGIRTYLETDWATDLSVSTRTNLTIAELIMSSIGSVFVMKLFSRLYESLLPQLRAQPQEGPDLFERIMVQQPKFVLLPITIMVIVGAIDSMSDSESTRNLGNILRKVGISILVALGLWYLFAAATYRSRYGSSGNSYAFSIAILATTVFDIALIYKCAYSFIPSLKTTTWLYFALSPLMEILGLLVLCQDLQKYFVGDAYIQQDIEIGPTGNSPAVFVNGGGAGGGGRRWGRGRLGRRFFGGDPTVAYPQQTAPSGYAPAPAGYYK